MVNKFLPDDIWWKRSHVHSVARQACTGLPNKMRIFLRIEEVVSAVLTDLSEWWSPPQWSILKFLFGK